MILIGMYDSPFVRRVALALAIYELPFEHRPWSVFRDADKVARFNPLIRVPTLVLDDGEVLVESSAILDTLDERVGAKALIPRSGDARRHQLQTCALALGTADKVVSLIYERAVHARATTDWNARCQRQIGGALDVLEARRAQVETAWWFGDALGHADIAVTCALTLAVDALAAVPPALGEAQPGFVLDAERWPLLAAHRLRCEALPLFADHHQPFFAPPPKA